MTSQTPSIYLTLFNMMSTSDSFLVGLVLPLKLSIFSINPIRKTYDHELVRLFATEFHRQGQLHFFQAILDRPPDTIRETNLILYAPSLLRDGSQRIVMDGFGRRQGQGIDVTILPKVIDDNCHIGLVIEDRDLPQLLLNCRRP